MAATKKTKGATTSGRTGRGTTTQHPSSPKKAASTATATATATAKRKLAETGHIANDGPSKRTRSQTSSRVPESPTPTPKTAASAHFTMPGPSSGASAKHGKDKEVEKSEEQGRKRGYTASPLSARRDDCKRVKADSKIGPLSSPASQRRRNVSSYNLENSRLSAKKGGVCSGSRSGSTSTREVKRENEPKPVRGWASESESESGSNSDSTSASTSTSQPKRSDSEEHELQYPRSLVTKRQNGIDLDSEEEEALRSIKGESTSPNPSSASPCPFTGLGRDPDEMFESLFRGVEHNSAAARYARVRARGYSPVDDDMVKVKSPSPEDDGILQEVPRYQHQARLGARNGIGRRFGVRDETPAVADRAEDDDEEGAGHRARARVRVRAEVARELPRDMEVLELQMELDTTRVLLDYAEGRARVSERYVNRLLNSVEV